jgi:hypothetical protein
MTLFAPVSADILGAWIATRVSVDGVALNSTLVGDHLPTDKTTWAAPLPGFVMLTEVGGTPNSELRQRQPVVTLDCYTNNGDSELALWHDAAALANAIRDQIETEFDIYTPAAMNPFVTIPGGNYHGARITRLNVLQEPRRVRTSTAGYARYSMDVECWWVQS